MQLKLGQVPTKPLKATSTNTTGKPNTPGGVGGLVLPSDPLCRIKGLGFFWDPAVKGLFVEVPTETLASEHPPPR